MEYYRTSFEICVVILNQSPEKLQIEIEKKKYFLINKYKLWTCLLSTEKIVIMTFLLM